jgi:hypothetical protein
MFAIMIFMVLIAEDLIIFEKIYEVKNIPTYDNMGSQG